MGISVAKQSGTIRIHTKTTTRRKKGSDTGTKSTPVKSKTVTLPKTPGKISAKTVTKSKTTTNVVKPGDKVIKRTRKKK